MNWKLNLKKEEKQSYLYKEEDDLPEFLEKMIKVLL